MYSDCTSYQPLTDLTHNSHSSSCSSSCATANDSAICPLRTRFSRRDHRLSATVASLNVSVRGQGTPSGPFWLDEKGFVDHFQRNTEPCASGNFPGRHIDPTRSAMLPAPRSRRRGPPYRRERWCPSHRISRGGYAHQKIKVDC